MTYREICEYAQDKVKDVFKEYMNPDNKFTVVLNDAQLERLIINVMLDQGLIDSGMELGRLMCSLKGWSSKH